MARAQSNTDWQDQQGTQHPGEWQALRADLIRLLNQVEGQVARKGTAAPERSSDGAENPLRRREALQSVRRAVERFSERDEENLQSALGRIRQRQDDLPPGGRVDNFGAAIGGIADRLERIEGELRHGRQSGHDLKDIARQVEQLTDVVELLAGAVGETGLVKRLETQIAGIARAVGPGSDGKASEISHRIDKLVTTIERLAEAQEYSAERPLPQIAALSAAHADGMRSIEESVRNVYDRIDTIERSFTIAPSEIERLSDEMAGISQEMAHVTQALKSGAGGSASNGVLARIDALNARVGQLEGGDGEVSGLKADVATLRDMVREIAEPHFSALRTQIENLDRRMGEGGASALEAQIRQLMVRMDQTGEQLSDITRLYQDGAERGEHPDLEALAELVARRTYETVARSGPPPADAGSGSFAHVQDGIREVNNRLASLEAMFSGDRHEASPPPQPSPLRKTQSVRPAPRGDSMAINPIEDHPLIDPGFAPPEFEPAPPPFYEPRAAPPVDVFADTEQHREPSPPAGFDPAKLERPAPPRSTLSPEAREFISAERKEMARRTEGEALPAGASRNAFIEAARQAARERSGDAGTRGPEKRASPARSKQKKQQSGSASPGASDAGGLIVRPGFLRRYRRPLLLAVALAAISLLTLNLISKRLADFDFGKALPAFDLSAIDGPAAKPKVDPSATGSVDPFAQPVAEPLASTDQALPLALTHPEIANTVRADETISTAAIPPQETVAASGIRLELPPEAIGPKALREAAANGDPRAQFEVAAIYTEGQALPRDFSAAARWYERAAAQGFAPAEYRIGNLYENGRGTTRDLQQARLWYQRAAEAGNRMAMHNLAALYAGGELGKQEFALAAEWFERAATRGLVDSQFNLGMLYARGLGVPQNLSAAYKWFSLAAAQGDGDAAKSRDDLARSLDAATLTRLRAEIAGWTPAQIDIGVNFAPIGTWTPDFDPGAAIDDRSVIERVQAALNQLGYDIGIPDGLMGPRTSDAIRDFERRTGMSESGAVNPRLLAVLGTQPV